MKLIHCADIHLDSKLNANLSKEKAKERKREILNTFVRLVEYAKTHDVDAILISGDLFDTKNYSALSKNTISNLIESNSSIKFYYLRGNHDENTFIDSFEEIPENLYLFNDAWKKYQLSDRVCLYGVELNSDNSVSVQHNFAPDPSYINIVMLHGQESESNGNDKTEIINLKSFRNKGIDYMALGHIHAVKVSELDGRGKYVYPGCLEGRGFDETGDHGFFLLDVNEENGTVKESFVSFAYRRIYEINVDIEGLLSTPEIVEKVKESLSNVRELDLVKVVLCGSVDVSCEKDTEAIRKFFEDDYYYIKVYDKSFFKVDPETYRNDCSLKGEFVRTVIEASDLSVEKKGEIIRMGLNVLAGGKPEL